MAHFGFSSLTMSVSFPFSPSTTNDWMISSRGRNQWLKSSSLNTGARSYLDRYYITKIHD